MGVVISLWLQLFKVITMTLSGRPHTDEVIMSSQWAEWWPFGFGVGLWVGCGVWHIEAETKWTPFRRRHFQVHLLNENVWITIQNSLKFVPKGPINNIPALVQIMAWRRPGDNPLSEPMMFRLPTHICVTRPQWVNYYKYLRAMPPARHRAIVWTNGGLWSINFKNKNLDFSPIA